MCSPISWASACTSAPQCLQACWRSISLSGTPLSATFRSARSLPPRRELFYWATVLCTFALGTAAGDLATEALGLGFTLGALIFAALIAVTLVAWRLGGNAVLTFWIAYILTRPFGAALGDLLTQAKTYGGLGLGATWTSAIFLCVILLLVTVAQLNVNNRQRLSH